MEFTHVDAAPMEIVAFRDSEAGRSAASRDHFQEPKSHHQRSGLSSRCQRPPPSLPPSIMPRQHARPQTVDLSIVTNTAGRNGQNAQPRHTPRPASTRCLLGASSQDWSHEQHITAKKSQGELLNVFHFNAASYPPSRHQSMCPYDTIADTMQHSRNSQSDPMIHHDISCHQGNDRQIARAVIA